MDRETAAELTHWLDESLKRNDRTYAALAQVLQLAPVGEGPEGDLRRACAAAEAHQQACRKTLLQARRLLREEERNAV